MSAENLLAKLELALKKLNLQDKSDLLFRYLTLLQKWNKTYNLTAVRDPEEMIYRHILDSLAIIPFIEGQKLIDVGTGPGLPGIPISIAKPEKEITLIDSNGKKISFLKEVKRNLGLNNLNIVQARVEEYHPQLKFTTIMSRAFSNIEQFLNWTKHLIQEEGIWLAMKGPNPKQELSSILLPFAVKSYFIEGLETNHTCVIIRNSLAN